MRFSAILSDSLRQKQTNRVRWIRRLQLRACVECLRWRKNRYLPVQSVFLQQLLHSAEMNCVTSPTFIIQMATRKARNQRGIRSDDIKTTSPMRITTTASSWRVQLQQQQLYDRGDGVSTSTVPRIRVTLIGFNVVVRALRARHPPALHSSSTKHDDWRTARNKARAVASRLYVLYYVTWRHNTHYNTVEFYLYPTVSAALVHSVKPKLTE